MYQNYPVAVVEGTAEGAETFKNSQASLTKTPLNQWSTFQSPVPIIKPYVKLKAVEGEINNFKLNYLGGEGMGG